MQPVYIIAEMSANHAGSFTYALEIVHAAKEAGADCIKIQTYTPDTMTLNAQTDVFTLHGGTWAGYNLYELYKEAYTPWDWQPRIKEEADKLGIDFMSTPFDVSAVDFLEELRIKAYKIASFELVDIPLLRYVARKGRPVILSTGMGTFEEIQEAVDAITGEDNKQLTLLKCASAYPAKPEQMNLASIPDMQQRFGFPVGLSDHSMGNLSTIMAVTLGASVIEKHFCLSRSIKNPDASFSMEPAEFAEMVRQIRDAQRAVGVPQYGVMEQERGNVQFRRSIFASKEIRKGEAFSENNIRVIRPSAGLHPRYYKAVLGKRAACDIPFATPMTKDMVKDI